MTKQRTDDWLLANRHERPGAGLRVPGARRGRGVVDARAVRVPVLQLAAVGHAPGAAPALARRLRLHAPPVVLLQDLHRQLLLPPRPAPPDVERPQIWLPGYHRQSELIESDRSYTLPVVLVTGKLTA